MVRIDGITKKYGKTTVLDQVSFSLDCSTYGLLGPNGSVPVPHIKNNKENPPNLKRN